MTRLTILSLLLFCALHFHSCRKTSTDTQVAFPDIQFCINNDQTAIVVPFQTDSGWVVCLPAHWDPQSILIGRHRQAWRPVVLNQDESIKVACQTQGTDDTITIRCLQSHLPTVMINTESGSMTHINGSKDKSIRESGDITIIKRNGKTALNCPLDYIKGRGNSSWLRKKKSYNIKLKQAERFLGLHKNKRFCLVSCNGTANYICLQIAKEFGTSYPIDVTPVSLYLNGDYYGVYLLTNKVEVSSHGIDIHDLSKENREHLFARKTASVNSKDGTYRYAPNITSPKDITGGYLIEVCNFSNRYARVESGFTAPGDIRVEIKSPERASQEEVLYIKNRFCELVNAIKAPDGRNPTNGLHYSDCLDIESAARYYLIEEVLGNMDGASGNLYLFKDRDCINPRLFMGPVWDMSWSLGALRNYPYMVCPQSFFVRAGSCNEKQRLFSYLYQHEDFRKTVNRLYQDELQPILKRYFVPGGKIDEVFGILTHDISINQMRWSLLQNEEYQNITTYVPSPIEYKNIMTYMPSRIEFFDIMTRLQTENGFCKVLVNAGGLNRNILYLIPRGQTFDLPDFSDFPPKRTDGAKQIDGWCLNGKPINEKQRTIITEDCFLEQQWK